MKWHAGLIDDQELLNDLEKAFIGLRLNGRTVVSELNMVNENPDRATSLKDFGLISVLLKSLISQKVRVSPELLKNILAKNRGLRQDQLLEVDKIFAPWAKTLENK